MIISDTRLVAAWVASMCECPIMSGCTALGVVQNGRIVAGVMYDHFTGRSIKASIAISPFARLGKEFWWMIFDYPFNQLGVERIIVTICESNTKSINLATKLGFKFEATVEGVYDDGAMLIATLTKSECKQLERYHGRKIQSTESA